MIKRLEIENFRTHKHTILDFVKGINCIIGLPESGKTNIIRDIRWILTNRPLGLRVQSDFTSDPTASTMEFEEGNEIALSKSKKTSEYLLNGTLLKALGKDVPDEVVKVAAMTDLNLQTQLDKPYLICMTPGDVAKTFNKITKLEKPDVAVSALTTDINSESKKLKILQAQKTQKKEKIEKLGDVKAMKSDSLHIEYIDENIKLSQANENDLGLLINQIELAQENLQQVGDIEAMKAGLEILISIDRELIDVEYDKDELSEIITDIEKKKEQCNSALRLKRKMEKDFLAIDDLDHAWNETSDQHEDLREIMVLIKRGNEEAEGMKRNLIVKAKEYREFLDTIDVCPYCSVCTAPIEEHNLDDAIKGLV